MVKRRKQTAPAARMFRGLNRQKQVRAMKKALLKKAKEQHRNQQPKDKPGRDS